MANQNECKSSMILKCFRNLLSILVRAVMGGIMGAIAGGFIGLLFGLIKTL